MEDPDYRQYLANLRSIGCPESTIADIIAADLHGLYEARRQEGAGMSRRSGGGKPGASLKPESEKVHRALWGEEAGVMKALLSSPPEWWRTLMSAALSEVYPSPGLIRDTTHGKQDARARTCPKCLAVGGATDPGVAPLGPELMAHSTVPEILRAKSGALNDWHRRMEQSNRDLETRREGLGPSPELMAEQEHLENVGIDVTQPHRATAARQGLPFTASAELKKAEVVDELDRILGDPGGVAAQEIDLGHGHQLSLAVLDPEALKTVHGQAGQEFVYVWAWSPI